MNILISGLIYLTIFLTTAAPALSLLELAIGPVHIFLFEIPLAVLFFMSLIVLFIKGGIHRNKYLYLMGSIFFLMLLALFIGKMYLYDTTTIIKGLRPYIYYLSGWIVLVFGGKIVNLKYILHVIIAGLIIQGLWGGYLYLTKPLEIYLTGMRLPYRTGFWIPFVIFTMVYIIKDNVNKNYRVKIFIYISIIALLFVILILNMNRTIWIATLLMTLMYLIKYFSLKNVFKIISAIIILFFLFFVTLNFSKYGQIAQKYLERRFYENTIGKAALGSVWKNNRDRIYNSAFIAFLDHPLLGNGAGYTYSWKVIKMWTVDELIDKNSTSIDISPLDILVKNGIIGAIIFWYFLYVVWIEIIKYEQNSKILEIDLLIIKGLKFYFPFMVLMSFNLSILFGYPAAITLSIIFSKIFLINEEYARE